ILPMGPEMQWSSEKQPELIDLYVYAGADGKFTLYEDEETNYNYERVLYSTITLSWDDKASTLTIGKRRGEYPGMLRKRRFNLIKVSPESPRGYEPGQRGVMVDYDGKLTRVKL
ncbi:MAG: DUF5110 domain-containing protein, partial [Duncaniella sp.]|nr:DUF5110 domain-containing protein [Duncaniella sp.]